MVEEIIDIYDKAGNKIGTASKKEAHLKGYWHKAAHIWIYNSKGEILLQKRAKNKDYWPGRWDISVAGHTALGEDPKDTAVRELSEELGIKVKLSDLKFIFTRTSTSSEPKINYLNNEIDDVYIYQFDGDISKLKIQDIEIDQIKFISLSKLESDIKNPNKYKEYVPHKDYYLKIIEIVREEKG